MDIYVTDIKEYLKNKYKIYLNDEFAFVLYKGELRSYKIKIGNELNTKDYEEIINNVLPKRAKLRCMNLLKSRDYTEAQLRKKLRVRS